ncbi:MAG: DUF2157 domain-containing protein [Chryseolinea sp.]
MSKQILKALPELVEVKVITEETALQIRKYYSDHPDQPTNRLFLVFGILGSLLVGMGIVLILAHNWDEFPKAVKLFIGLFPLLASQAVCGYLFFSGSNNRTSKEVAACFLVFSIAISISIVSQVYNIEGNLGDFILYWMVLTLPVVYLMRASFVSLLFICGTTWYGCETSYFNYPHDVAIYYWILLALIIPFYYTEYLRTHRKNNFFYFHSWLLALSLTICLATFAQHNEEIILIAYMSMFSAFIMISDLRQFDTGRVISNAFLVIGSLGVIGLMLSLSFSFFWDSIDNFRDENFALSLEFIVSIVVSLAAAALLLITLRTSKLSEVNNKSSAFIFFIILFIVGISMPALAQILTNFVILLFAVTTILSGARKNHLGILNYGLLIITALIICRFFDTDFSFVIRGLLFIAVGAGFFAANFYLIRKRKTQS